MSILIQNTKAYIGKALELQDCHLFADDSGRLKIIPINEEQLTDEQKQAECVLDGRNLLAMPSFTDLHVHFREPGFEHKETLLTGQYAAIRGGVAQVVTMPNTKPPIDRAERLTHYQHLISKNPLIDILPSVAITLDQGGQELTDLEALTQLGAAAYTDDGRTVMNPEHLIEALNISKRSHKLVMTHSEDHEAAAKTPDKPYPPEVESDIVARDIQILEQTGGHLHIAHLSTEGALKAVAVGKRKGLTVSCEVSPHHLYFDADQLEFETAKYKVNPPLRGEANRQALIEGVKAGFIDAIASDHAPHEASSKSAPYATGAYGFTGLETMFSVVHTVFEAENIPMQTLIQMMSLNPRKLLGQAPNYLVDGVQANVVLVDPNAEWTVQAEELASKSQNSPWIGKTLKGKVIHLIKDRQLLLKGGQINVI